MGRWADLRVLVVGAGVMGTVHARTVASATGATLCGIVDGDAAVARARSDELGVAGFTDLGEAIARARPDAAIVATPDRAHRPPTEALIAAGVPVLVEKPLATTVADAEAIATAAARSGVPVMPGHTLRFDPRYVEAAEAVRSGAVGRPLLVTANAWGPRSLGARVAEVTTPLWHFAIHDVDVIQWLAAAAVAHVDAAHAIACDGRPDAFSAIGRLDGGCAFQVAAGWTVPAGADPHAEVTVHGASGIIRIVRGRPDLTIVGAHGPVAPANPAWPAVYGRVAGLIRTEVEHFLACLREGAPFAVSVAEAVAAVRAAAALEAATTQQRPS